MSDASSSSTKPYQHLNSLLHSLVDYAGRFGFTQRGHQARVQETQGAALLDGSHVHDPLLPLAHARTLVSVNLVMWPSGWFEGDVPR